MYWMDFAMRAKSRLSTKLSLGSFMVLMIGTPVAETTRFLRLAVRGSAVRSDPLRTPVAAQLWCSFHPEARPKGISPARLGGCPVFRHGLLEYVPPGRPQSDGHADADGDDHEQGQCESNEKTPHRLSFDPPEPVWLRAQTSLPKTS
jgi:hypothetical protein